MKSLILNYFTFSSLISVKPIQMEYSMDIGKWLPVNVRLPRKGVASSSELPFLVNQKLT